MNLSGSNYDLVFVAFADMTKKKFCFKAEDLLCDFKNTPT